MTRHIFALILCGWQLAGYAQSFVGTNAPNAATNFALIVPPSATNLSLVVSNSANAYSYLLLKRNGTPTDSDFDFISRINGWTNHINLELPEFQTGNYGLRVRTPSASATQAFTVVMTTDRQDLRSSSYPVLKPHAFTTTGTLTNSLVSGTWHYFQVDVPTNLPGWRIVLSTNSGSLSNPDLFLRRGQLPTQSSFDKGSQSQAIDTLTLTDSESTNFTYFIGVFLPPTAAGPANYTLSTEIGYLKHLTWDPGAGHEGTQVYTNTSPTGGDYFFRITTQNPSAGAWRTALYVDSGEADVSIRQNTFHELYSQYTYRQSARAGSDGWVLHSSDFSAAQNWYIVVRTTAGAQWRLFTGDVFVQNLGALATDASSSSGPVPMGAEGMRFFRTTTTAATLAWRLWLNGANNQLMVRNTSVPHPRTTSTYDWQGIGQMLLVPAYLVGGQSYFVGVIGSPGETINLDSRQHGFTDVAFNSNTPLNLNGYGYTTYRVQVPVQQIAWLTTVTPGAGDANVAVRRDFIPNEFYNTAFSEVGGSVADSVSLVPPTLSDGTYYITVWGNAPYTCNLFTGNPTVTDVAFESVTQNDDPGRVGWRYYRVPNIASQLGTLGWDLILSNYVANTELAIRQNAVPSRWNLRNGGSNVTSSAHVDFTGGTRGFLQRPGHQADIWYIGVYNPGTALGPFWLILEQLEAALTSFDGGSATRTGALGERWEYFRFDVPAGCLGWDVRLVNVLENGAQPLMIIRRDQLPDGLTTSGWLFPQNSQTWPSGNRWRAGGDWTGRSFNPSGTVDEDNRILAMGTGRPLEPGTYYVGVINQNATPMTYTLQSRGIGPGLAIPVTPLAFNGSATNTLLAREAAYYSLDIPPGTPSWKMKLRAATGESLMIVLKDVLPGVGAHDNAAASATDSGHKLQKLADEQWLLLPGTGTNLAAGTYYVAVVSEGVNPTASNRIGAGPSIHEISSLGPLPITDMGTLSGVDLSESAALEGGEAAAYQFSVPAGTLAMEVWLENTSGQPAFSIVPSVELPQPNNVTYGAEGGRTTGRMTEDKLLNVTHPAPGTWSVIVKANGSAGNYPAASYTLRVHRLFATNVVFDNGSIDVTNHQVGTWRYFRIDVPADALGWDVRLINVFTNGSDPQFSIRRDFAPSSLGTLGWLFPMNSTNWPTGNQWGVTYDWSGREYDPSGQISEYGRIHAMGMGRPLEPGTYYIGVINSSGSTNAMAYTLLSRGIGTNMTIPVTQIAFAGGSFSTNGLPAREAAYFAVNVPGNMSSWKIKLTTNASESLMIILRGALPSVAAKDNAANSATDSGAELQKAGNEHFVLLPVEGQTSVPAGNYYFAVVAEGINTTNTSRIGTGSSSFTLESLGPLPVTDLGVLTPADITQPGALEGGEIAPYQFTVPPGTLSMEVRLENRVGNPEMVLRPGTRVPVPNSGSYGHEGGHTSGRLVDDQLITVPNPTNGVWSLVVKASVDGSVYSNATYTIRISAVTATPVAFDGGSISVTNHPAGTWRYYRIEVPASTFGWDLRITDVPTNGNVPRLVVRRDQLPTALTTTGWQWPQSTPNWPTGNQWAAGDDWTRRSYSANGLQDESGRILAVGMGRPLEAGTYYVGVINSGSATNLLAYTLLSRGIGTNMSIGITPLSFAGGMTNHPGLPPREAAYFLVEVPTNAPSWKIRLAATSGDSVLHVLRHVLPSVASHENASGSSNPSGARVSKTGNEHYVILPPDGQTNIPGGPYYLAVASEGMNLTNANRIGVGTSLFTLTSEGVLPVNNLGTIGSSSVDHTLEGGEMRAYHFTVAPGVQAFEARLDNRVGSPTMAMRLGAMLPFSGANTYGEEGGSAGGRVANNTILTIANPSNALYALNVKAGGTGFPDSSYTLNVEAKPVIDLSFAPDLNTPTVTNVVGQLLVDDQRAFYRVVVPGFHNGHPVIGWRLVLTQTSGKAQLRVRRNALPADAGDSQTPYNEGDVVIVAPFLTPGTWYVEVRATGSTEFQLTSDELLLERPAWDMQPAGQPTTTPGLTAPEFGDTGTDTTGNPLPGDHGIDLERNFFHYYAVNVPTNNSGLMRMVLEAINGNPDLYLRTNAPPTLAHGPSGPIGPVRLYERYLDETTTEYANWVGVNGRFERELTPGTYYISVRAVTSNVRYRLRLSAGDVQDLALLGGTLNNQILAAGDWRYYRVYVPTNAPREWNVTFNQIVGNVVMYVRDTSPPGQGRIVTDIIDWQDDNKNHHGYPNYDPAGTHAIGCPPLRPGHTYYLGFRAVNDATFSVSSSVSAANVDVTNVIAFYGGVTNTTIPANGSLRFRVDVPLDARRWIHRATNASSVRIYIDQGSCPSLTVSDHYSCSSANCTANNDLTGGTWPWLPGYMYFVTVTNASASSQPFYFRMDGRDCYNFPEDQDNDQLPDCWELVYWPSIVTHTTLGDPDNDGVPNLYEYLNGSDPTMADTFYLTAWVQQPNGWYEFLFVGRTNGRYRIQAAPALTGAWTQIRLFTNSTGTTLITDTNATNFSNRFYRARSQ